MRPGRQKVQTKAAAGSAEVNTDSVLLRGAGGGQVGALQRRSVTNALTPFSFSYRSSGIKPATFLYQANLSPHFNMFCRLRKL